MTEHWGHLNSNFICVDQEQESAPGSHANHNGALFYAVQTDCNYFSGCPPYDTGRELTFALCTK